MNDKEAKNLVATLRYLEAVAESLLIQTLTEWSQPEEGFKVIEGEAEEVVSALSAAIKNLPTVDPTFRSIIAEVDREATARGQQWSRERAQKIALLRLAGDDTPEEQIP